jgi:hypothetical protein
MLDQSGSMAAEWQKGKSKAAQLATIVNSALRNIVLMSTKGGVLHNYCDIAVVGYGGDAQTGVRSMLPETSLLSPFLSIEQIAPLPKVRVIKEVDGSSRREISWFDGVAEGGTPMNTAFLHVAKALDSWVKDHPNSFPPVVINITDGESTDGSPASAARDLTGLSTEDGNVLLFTAFLATGAGKQLLYPNELPQGVSGPVHEMFSITSFVPEVLRVNAEGLGIRISSRGRGLLYNASLDEVSGLINFGTSVAAAPKANE